MKHDYSYWNHRLIFAPAEDSSDSEWYISEVHYNSKDEPIAWTGSVGPRGNTASDMVEDFERMLRAIDKEVLVEVDGNPYRKLVPWLEWLKEWMNS